MLLIPSPRGLLLRNYSLLSEQPRGSSEKHREGEKGQLCRRTEVASSRLDSRHDPSSLPAASRGAAIPASRAQRNAARPPSRASPILDVGFQAGTLGAASLERRWHRPPSLATATLSSRLTRPFLTPCTAKGAPVRLEAGERPREQMRAGPALPASGGRSEAAHSAPHIRHGGAFSAPASRTAALRSSSRGSPPFPSSAAASFPQSQTQTVASSCSPEHRGVQPGRLELPGEAGAIASTGAFLIPK